jgi:hypothetical protein
VLSKLKMGQGQAPAVQRESELGVKSKEHSCCWHRCGEFALSASLRQRKVCISQRPSCSEWINCAPGRVTERLVTDSRRSLKSAMRPNLEYIHANFPGARSAWGLPFGSSVFLRSCQACSHEPKAFE